MKLLNFIFITKLIVQSNIFTLVGLLSTKKHNYTSNCDRSMKLSTNVVYDIEINFFERDTSIWHFFLQKDLSHYIIMYDIPMEGFHYKSKCPS